MPVVFLQMTLMAYFIVIGYAACHL